MRTREILTATPFKCAEPIELSAVQEAVIKNSHNFAEALWDAYVARQIAALTEAGILPFASHEDVGVLG